MIVRQIPHPFKIFFALRGSIIPKTYPQMVSKQVIQNGAAKGIRGKKADIQNPAMKKDGWTVVTADKKIFAQLSAQWENTIAVTADVYEVLTLREEEMV